MSLTVLNVSYPLAKVSPSTAGGAEQALLTLDKALVQHGCHSIVVAPYGSRCHGLLVPVQIPSGPLNESVRREVRQSFAQKIKSTIDCFPIDVVHMHGLDFHTYLPETTIPVVVSLHLPLRWYDAGALRDTSRKVSLICVSKSQALTAPAKVGIDRVIPNGIDLDRIALVSKRQGDYFLVLGRICPEKAVHLAIDAAAAVNEQVVIAGEVYEYAEHRTYFGEEIRPRLNSRVRFIGPVGGMRKVKLLAGAKGVLIPSHAPETSSLVAMEALSAGTPVIAWRSGALPEIVEDGVTGFVVSSVEEMSAAMKKIHEIGAEHCRREAGRRFSAERMFTDFLNLYRELASVRAGTELAAA